MSKTLVTVEGIPGLKAALAAKVEELRVASAAAVAEEVDLIAADAEQHAPKGPTGDLAGSVDGTSSGPNGRVTTDIRYAHFVEHGTYKDKAQPFMKPAAERARKRFPARAAAIIRIALGG